MASQGFDNKQIADELNLNPDNVQSIIISENLAPKTHTAKDLMINKTAVKKTNSVSIMTQEASMANDHNRSKYQSDSKKSEHIFNPLEK